MKSILLKTKIALFGFSLAIMTSLAFSPSYNIYDDKLYFGYMQNPDGVHCVPKATCSETGIAFCTYKIYDDEVDLFKLEAGPLCVLHLYKGL